VQAGICGGDGCADTLKGRGNGKEQSMRRFYWFHTVRLSMQEVTRAGPGSRNCRVAIDGDAHQRSD
jgi:hypothetical protein